jgi:hypothetical protein
MVLRARNAGLRSYLGEVVGAGQWEPIVDPVDYHALLARLTAPGRRTTPGRDGKTHLLSGVARCGVCGEVVRVGLGKAYKGVRGKPIYRCRARACVSREQRWTDTLVAEVVVQRLARPDAVDLLRHADEDEARQAARLVDELRERLSDAAEAYAAGTLTLAQITTITATLEPKINEAATVVLNPQRARLFAGVIGERNVRDAWEAVGPARRREMVSALMDVTILPTRSGPVRDPESVRITWKTTP